MAELDWKFTQSFGEKDNEDVAEVDIVSAVQFDQTGDFLGVGDKGGRIWIFEGHPAKKRSNSKFQPLEYRFYTEFQSHEPEFDCLKSLEIEEKINIIKWCKRQNESLLLLSTNDKTIKLWKIYEKKMKKPSVVNVPKNEEEEYDISVPVTNLKIPQISYTNSIPYATPKRLYQNAHTYHVNSLSVNSDGETFISADDLRVNLWHFDVLDQSYNIVDLKPDNMDELNEVVTSASFHPEHCNMMMYTSSRGIIRLADLRQSALCDNHVKLYEDNDDSVQKSFFSEIVASICDGVFAQQGRYMLVRDYLYLKLWDIKMERKPVLTIPVHDYIKPKLCDLYENDCIFDKFYCATSPDGTQFLTGSYNSYFMIYDSNIHSTLMVEASKPPPRKTSKLTNKSRSGKFQKPLTKEKPFSLDPDRVNFDKKVMFCAWHSKSNAVAVAGLNNLYLYQA